MSQSPARLYSGIYFIKTVHILSLNEFQYKTTSHLIHGAIRSSNSKPVLRPERRKSFYICNEVSMGDYLIVGPWRESCQGCGFDGDRKQLFS